MTNSAYAMVQCFLTVASLTALSALATPVQAQAVKTDVQTIEQKQEQTTEVQTTETEVQTTETEIRTTETEIRTTETEVERVEASSEVRFTQTVQVAVFEAIAQRSRVNASNLQILEVSRRSWTDSCLGLPGQGGCTQAITPGYLVSVTDGQQVWVYRTNATGTGVVFDEQATTIRMAQLRVRNTQVSFPDVPTDHWAIQYIRELAALDILEGYPDQLYRPNAPVTRAEFAAIIRRAFQVTAVRNTINFVDVEEDYWARTAINEAYEMGFLNASNSEFRPKAQLFRGDILFAIARGLNISTTDVALDVLSRYSDVTVSSSEARLLLASLTNRGMIVNYPNAEELNLNRVATRAEVAVLVYQALCSMGYVSRINSSYTAQDTTVVKDIGAEVVGEPSTTSTNKPRRQNCNQGIGNGAEGCDPGNSSPRGGSNDEGGRTPGQKP
ncbi:MAG TPA: S-layer homology domain-containing protein [Leptolyngbyaceae cyanobacterium M33_DOE_097]|uniref:S-layer homology domain-containing protein n=1 Tax=Oscillatoriales cyanobacterium SpSt-418 TaxID=2282169 RepID=A0A7C3KFE5_9CYAN|nr:S-layer homology domain-containing protein [Leptolyngbyaceae cyanobacterium M33_DOE_097]